MELKDMKDCVICGSKGSMEYRTGKEITFTSKKYSNLVVKDLDGYFCNVCNDGFYTKESNDRIGEEMKKKAREYENS